MGLDGGSGVRGHREENGRKGACEMPLTGPQRSTHTQKHMPAHPHLLTCAHTYAHSHKLIHTYACSRTESNLFKAETVRKTFEVIRENEIQHLKTIRTLRQ